MEDEPSSWFIHKDQYLRLRFVANSVTDYKNPPPMENIVLYTDIQEI